MKSSFFISSHNINFGLIFVANKNTLHYAYICNEISF